MLRKSPVVGLLLSLLLLVACVDTEPVKQGAEVVGQKLKEGFIVGAKELPKAAAKVQPLKEIDPELIKLGDKGIIALNERIKEINRTLAAGVSANVEVGATEEAQALIKKVSDQLSNLKVGVDDRTLAEIGGYLDIIQRGVKVGLDAETLMAMDELIRELANQPGKWEQTLTNSANRLDKTATKLASEIRSTIDFGKSSFLDVTATFNAGLKCNADFIQQTASNSVDDIIGRGLFERISATLTGRALSAKSLVSGVCEVNPDSFRLFKSGGKLMVEDTVEKKPELKIFGYGFTDDNPPVVQIIDDKDVIVGGFDAIKPSRVNNYIVSFNLQGIDFSALGYRNSMVITWPNLKDKTRITIYLPPPPPDTPVPPTVVPTTTPLPSPSVTVIVPKSDIFAGPNRRQYRKLGTAKQADSFTVTGLDPTHTWWRIDYKGEIGYIYSKEVNNQFTSEVKEFSNPAVPVYIPKPPTITPTPTCPQITLQNPLVSSEKVIKGQQVTISWNADPNAEGWKLKAVPGDTLPDLGSQISTTLFPKESATYYLYAVYCGGKETPVGQVAIQADDEPPPPPVVEQLPPSSIAPAPTFIVDYQSGLRHILGGGGNGGEKAGTYCPSGAVATGIYGRSGERLDRLQLLCRTLNIDGTLGSPVLGEPMGGGGGDPFQAECNEGQILIGMKGRTGDRVDYISGVCASIDRSGQTDIGGFGGDGGSEFISYCPPNYFLVGVFGNAGSEVDKVGFTCAKILQQ